MLLPFDRIGTHTMVNRNGKDHNYAQGMWKSWSEAKRESEIGSGLHGWTGRRALDTHESRYSATY